MCHGMGVSIKQSNKIKSFFTVFRDSPITYLLPFYHSIFCNITIVSKLLKIVLLCDSIEKSVKLSVPQEIYLYKWAFIIHISIKFKLSQSKHHILPLFIEYSIHRHNKTNFMKYFALMAIR